MARGSPLIAVMAAAADKAARTLIRDFNEVENLQRSAKGAADFVAAAERRAARTLKEELAKARPGFGFLMAEAARPGDGGDRFVVDPLGGAPNFVRATPQACVSLAAEREGEPFAGAVFDFLRDELFWAEKGRGAWLNQRRLRVGRRDRLADCLIAHGRAASDRPADRDRLIEQTGAVLARARDLRRMGVAALDLAWVAAGRLDGFWQEGLEPWDMAAGVVLVREAGGYATGVGGGPVDLAEGSVLAGNPHVHDRLHKALAGR